MLKFWQPKSLWNKSKAREIQCQAREPANHLQQESDLLLINKH